MLICPAARIFDAAAVADLMEDFDRTDPAAFRKALVGQLLQARKAGMATIAEALRARPLEAEAAKRSYTWLTDELVLSAWRAATEYLHPLSNPTDGERLALIAVGGYGRDRCGGRRMDGPAIAVNQPISCGSIPLRPAVSESRSGSPSQPDNTAPAGWEATHGLAFAAFSSARRPPRMPYMLWFPSWHAYSYIGTSVRCSGIDAVHGRVHVSGSVTVKRYSSVSASVRVKRSTNVMFSLVPRQPRS